MLKELLEHPNVTEECVLRNRFGVMAYHGGNLERTTDAVASEIASRTDSSYYGVLQAAPLRRHIASTRFDPAHSASLAKFLDHVDIVATVHGYGRVRLWGQVLLGGQNRGLAAHVAGHLRVGLPARYRIVDDLDEIPRELRGQHPRNPVNLPRQRGVQIELPPNLRWNRREWGWSDHQGISRAPDVAKLIDAVSNAISSWRASQ